jgi:hypothetical protein
VGSGKAVSRAHEPFLRGLGRRDHVHDAPAEDHEDAVAGQRHLGQLGGVVEDRGALPRELAHEGVDLRLGAHVDAPRGVEEQERGRAFRDPPADRHLLLVAPRQAAHLPLRAGVDLEPLDGGADPRLLLAHPRGAPAAGAGEARQGDVLAHGAHHEEGVRPVARHEAQARGDGVGGVAEHLAGALDLDDAAGGAAQAAQRLEELVLPLPFQPHDAQNLALPQLEADRAELGPDREVRDPQPRGARGRGPRRLGRAGGLAGEGGAQHELHRAVLDPRLDGEVADGGPVAQHRGAVAERGDLGEAVRDVDDGATGIGLGADHAQHPLHEVRGQRRRHLVEHEEVGLGRQRAGEVEDAQGGERQVAHPVVEPEARDAELAHPVQERLARGVAQARLSATSRSGMSDGSW